MLHDDEGCERDVLSPQQRSQSVELVIVIKKTDPLIAGAQIGFHINAEASELLHLAIHLAKRILVAESWTNQIAEFSGNALQILCLSVRPVWRFFIAANAE